MTKKEAYLKFWNKRRLNIENEVDKMVKEEVKNGASDSPALRSECLYCILSKIGNQDKTTFYAGWEAVNDLGN